MFSRLNYKKIIKLSFAYVVTAVLSTSLVSCTPEIGEKPPDPEDMQLASTQCLSESANQLKLFFEAKVTNQELGKAWACVELAFIQFAKYVRGRDKDRYTSQEIVDFLEKNFFSDSELEKQKISPELQLEMMKIKRILIGGSTEYVTRDELRKSPEMFRRLSKLTQDLNPFMKIIVMSWKPNLSSLRSEDLDTFEKSNIALQVFAKELAEIIKLQKSDYRIDDAINLIKELEKFFGEDWQWVEEIEKYVPGAKKLKTTLAGGSENLITNEEWPPVLILGARGYFQFLRYYYFIRNTHETGGSVGLIYVARTLEDTFSIFQDLLAYKKAGFVSRKEIYELLKAFEGVWSDLRVSESLILEVMKVKQLLIGGSIDAWTVEDFEKARLSVPKYRKIIERFLPYYSIYTFDWDTGSYSPEEARKIFKESQERLAAVAAEFSTVLVGSYSYKEFLSVIQEFEHLYPSEDGTSLTKDMAKFENLFIQGNNLLFGRNDSVVTTETWGKILPLVAKLYSIFQYSDYFLSDANFRQTNSILDMGVVLDDTVSLANDVFKLRAEVLKQDEGYFTQAELVQLTMAFSDAELLPSDVRKETYDSLWTFILQHILFDPEKRLNGEKNQLLKVEQFTRLKNEFNSWKVTQIALNKIFEDNPEKTFTPNEMLRTLKALALDETQSPEVRKGVTGVFSLLEADVPQTLDSEHQLQISVKTQWQYKLNALFQANLSQTLSTLLVRSFSVEKNLVRVSKCEATVAFDLLAGALKDFGIFDLGSGFIDSRFLEANIFMIRGNGDNYLDRNEIAEMATVIISGLRVQSNLEKSVRNQCEIYKDAKGNEFLTYKCLSEHHYVAVRKYMSQMPDFKAYVDKMAAKDKLTNFEDEFVDIASREGFAIWNGVFKATLKATGWKPNKGYGNIKQESVYVADSLYYPFIVHYLELLYAKYDKIRVDGIIQAAEARRAFPTFKPLLKELAQSQLEDGLIKESDLLAVFTFILRYQEEPGFSNLFRWLWWKSNTDKWDVWVSRTEMAGILGYIADRAASSSSGSGGGGNQCKKSAASQEP